MRNLRKYLLKRFAFNLFVQFQAVIWISNFGITNPSDVFQPFDLPVQYYWEIPDFRFQSLDSIETFANQGEQQAIKF